MRALRFTALTLLRFTNNMFVNIIESHIIEGKKRHHLDLES